MGNLLKRRVGQSLAFVSVAISLLLLAGYFSPGSMSKLLAGQALHSAELAKIPANRWVRYDQSLPGEWHRQGHAGIAYDTKRTTFYIFGSDTHGGDWDNSVHEFDPETRSWSTHYPPAAADTYRVDNRGIGVSGDARILPWAMHTFDNIIYDPLNDALVVTAKPDHNPVNQVPGKSPRIHPTWFYSLQRQTWSTLDNLEQEFPGNFAGASAYDEERQAIVSYGYGLAELGPDRKKWLNVPVHKPHELHYSMEYDPLRKQLFVFGDYSNSNAVWVYTPGQQPGEAGAWEQRNPGGDDCPPDQHFPVAFDRHQGVFLLVPDNNPASARGDSSKLGWAKDSSTFVYDPDRNEYFKLPEGDLPAQGMNYMMVYDVRRRVFLLVSGEGHNPPEVWALRLDLAFLQQ